MRSGAVRACVELARRTGAVACFEGSPEMAAFLAPTAAANATDGGGAAARAPLALLRPEQESTVEEIVAFCREHALSLSVLGGGHTCHSAAPGTICVDLRGLNQCAVVGRGRARHAAIRCQGGASLGQIARVAAESNYVVPLGTAPTVGAGAVLMGGVGHLSRLHGMSVANILALRIVTPGKGMRVLELGDEHNVGDDVGLFWAARGGAPGLGVVTEFTLRCFPSLGPWTVQHDTTVIESPPGGDATTTTSSQLRSFLQQYGASAPLNSRERTTDCYVHFTQSPTKRNQNNNNNKASSLARDSSISCTVSTFSPSACAENGSSGAGGSVHDEDQGNLAETGTVTTVPCLADLFAHEKYLSVDPPAHAVAHARSVFLSAISPYIARVLATGMVGAPEGVHCTLHLQQGGGVTREVVEELQCAGNIGGWEFSAVVTAFIPRGMSEEKAEKCRMWVDDMLDTLCVESEETIGVYATDVGPCRGGKGGGGLAQRCWTESTRERLAAAKAEWDPTGVLSSHVPFVNTVVAEDHHRR